MGLRAFSYIFTQLLSFVYSFQEAEADCSQAILLDKKASTSLLK